MSQRRPELKEVQVLYSTRKEFEANAKKMKIMFDFRVSNSLQSYHCLSVSIREECPARHTKVLSVSCTEVEEFT